MNDKHVIAMRLERELTAEDVGFSDAPHAGNDPGIDPLDRMIFTEKGRPKACLANAILMLRHDPEWQGVLAFNQFTLQAVTKKPAPWQDRAGANWSDYDDSRCAAWLQHRDVGVTSAVAAEAVQTVAKDNAFHPVRDYLKSLIWDKRPRIDTWLTTYLGATETAFTRAAGARWLISAVARICRPGCQADHTLLLEGPQGIGKSSALRVLASEPWFTDHISDLGNKDSRIELHGRWIIEMAELAPVSRGERERVKGFLTATTDNFRPPYGRRVESVPRSCVFAGTTNDQTCLSDETGARRFWPVTCGAIDIEKLTLDRDQLWAEAYARYVAGEVWWLNTLELNQLAAEEQDERYDADAWDHIILKWSQNPLRRPEASEPCISEPYKVTVQDVLVHAIGMPVDRITQAAKNRVAKCLLHDGWRRTRDRSGTHKNTWFYRKGDDVSRSLDVPAVSVSVSQS